MDFLKQLVHDEDERKPAPPAVAVHQDSVPEHHNKEGGSFLGKLSSFVDSQTQPTHSHNTPPPAVPAQREEEDSGILSKLSALGLGHKSDHHPLPPTVATPAPPPKDESIFDKIGDFAAGRKTPPPPPVAPVPAKEEHFFDRLSNLATGTRTPPPPPLPVEEKNFLEKLGERAAGKKTPPPTDPEQAHIFDKVAELVSGKKTPPPKDTSFMGKIDGMLGGGHKAEQKEDTLDKTIDLVQEHIFKSGPQHNETALEQAKDRQIADAIRHGFKNVTGRDFPGSDKKD